MDEKEAAALYRLMTWLSPAFPVGAFSYSSGIEWAVEAGDIGDAASLRDWLAAMLADGSGFCDGVFLAHAHRAAGSRDQGIPGNIALRDIAELASAFVPSRERQLETSAQGRAFIDIARAAWNCDGLDERSRVARVQSSIPSRSALSVRACDSARSGHARVSPRGRLELDLGRRPADPARPDRQPARTGAARAGRRRYRSPRARRLARRSRQRQFRADLASLRHETQYTRLFRS